jgi:glutamyl-tRNA reductase
MLDGTNTQPRIFVLGANHLTASVSLRDRLLFNEEALQKFMDAMLRDSVVSEIAVLSTCNRSEVYAVAAEPREARLRIERAWAARSGISEDELRNHGYFFTQDEAVRHLFRVIGSLDSLVLGEMQILGQVKEAYQLAAQNRCTDFYLNHVFQSGLHTGKRIHAETGIHEGAVSISYAAVELARKVLGELDGRTVGVVGAGEMGELAAQHLHKAGCRNFLFFNRTLGPAERMAAAFGGEAHLMPELPERLAHCDILISATGSPDIVITRDHVQNAARHRHGRPLFLVDIAAPRDIDPEAGEVGNTFLFTIDDLKNAVSGNVELRRQEARRAEAIVEEEATKVEAWARGLEIVPVLRALREKYQAIADREVEKWAAGQPELRTQLEALSRGLLNKFLHDPTTRLKLLGEQGDGPRASYYADALFALAQEEKQHGT